MKVVYKANSVALKWAFIDATTHSDYEFGDAKAKLTVYSCNYAKQYDCCITGNVISTLLCLDCMPCGIYSLECTYWSLDKKNTVRINDAFQVSLNPSIHNCTELTFETVAIPIFNTKIATIEYISKDGYTELKKDGKVDKRTIYIISDDEGNVQILLAEYPISGDINVALSLATAETIGGIKAEPKTENEVIEVKIDPNTGKLYTSSKITKADNKKFGGIKANQSTENDTQEVRINSDGFLVTAPGVGGGTDSCRLFLPDTIRWEVGKPLYIFKNSIISAYNYKDYNVQVLMNTDAPNGKDYHRYFMYNPAAEGSVNLTFKLYDNNHNLLDTQTVTLISKKPKTPSSPTNVLFIGDSLTFYNRITDEFYRVLSSSSPTEEVSDTLSVYKVIMPSGRGINNINLIGTQIQHFKGWTGKTKHEGYSGWEWGNFIKSGSPFYIGGSLNFTRYLSNNGLLTPNIIYIGLGWNDSRNVTYSNGKWDVSSIYNNARTFLLALTTQLPDAKIRLWTQNVPGTRGGMGNHPYGAVEWADEHRAKLVQLAIAEMYKTLVSEFSNVELVWATAMIDSEYGLQESYSAINGRINEREVRGVDYVHPADSAFFQIADALISDFTHCVTGTDTPTPSIDGGYTSAYGQSILDYQGVLKLFSSASLITIQSAVRGIDVSAYMGKAVKITAAQNVIQGAYYSFFLSELPSVVPTLSALSGATFGDVSNFVSENRDIIVSKFNISTSDCISNTVAYNIPEGAKYLFFANLYAYEQNPTVLITDSGEDVPEIETLEVYSTDLQSQTILDYQNSLKLFNSATLAEKFSAIYALDVSAYMGKAVKITAVQNVIQDAYYSFFLSELPSNLDNLADLTAKVFDTPDVVVSESRDIIVKRFHISKEDSVANTVAYNIPEGAKYLFFANLNAVQRPFIEIVEEAVDLPDVEDTKGMYIYKSAIGNIIMDYGEKFSVFYSDSVPKAVVCGVDVSDLAGKSIEITAAQNVIEGASYSFFLSGLPTTIPNLESLEGKKFETADITNAEDKNIIVDSFVVSDEDLVAKTVVKSVPENAKYLLFTNHSNVTTASVVIKE